MTTYEEIEQIVDGEHDLGIMINLPNGTRNGGSRLHVVTMTDLSYQRAARENTLTHAHRLEWKSATVLATEDDDLLRNELIDLAAMAVKWIEDIDARKREDCQGTTGEAPKVEDQRASDPAEAKDPGNGQRNTADPSASGNPPTEPAGRRDLRAPQKTEESPQGEVGRPAEGGNALTFALFSKANRLRCERDFGERLGPESSHGPADWVLNVVEEVGEIAKAVLGVTGKKKRKAHLTIEDIGEEIADTVTYLDLLASYYDLSLGTLVMEKFNRVSDRIGSKIKIRAGDTASPAPDVSMCSSTCGKTYGGAGTSLTIFCTPACCSSGRPLNPAPEVQQGEPGCRGRECADSTCPTCEAVPDAAWIAWKTGKSPEGQQGGPPFSQASDAALARDVAYEREANREPAWCATWDEGQQGEAKASACFIRNCPTHRPPNPAPEVQPVPAGFRLGDGWVAGGALHPGGYTAVYCDMLHMAEAVYVRRNEDGYIVEGACRDHAIAAGALVPIDPTPAPEDDACKPTGRGDGEPDGAAAPEGQQGEAKASECPGCVEHCEDDLCEGPHGPCVDDPPGVTSQDDSVCWCSPGCREAEKPLNPAPEGQPVQASATCKYCLWWQPSNNGRLCVKCGKVFGGNIGTHDEPQPDAIKAAVTAANNRAADAFHDWVGDTSGRAAADDFEEWLRSGDPAAGTVKP